MTKHVSVKKTPAAIGPYSQVTTAGQFVFTAGQIALDPTTGQLVGGDAAAQTRQVMVNLGNILAEAGAGWDDVVKATVYVADLNDYAAVNEVYAEFVGKVPPARAAVQVAALPKGALVEIDLIAYIGRAGRIRRRRSRRPRYTGRPIPLKAELAKRGLKINFVAAALGAYPQRLYAVLGGREAAAEEWVKPLAKILDISEEKARRLLAL